MQKFICDFESALLQAIDAELPGCKRIQGCFFHLRQAKKRSVGQRNMLKKLKEDRQFRHSFNLLSALAFVPIEDVKHLFEMVIQEDSFSPDLMEYATQYFKPT